MKTIVKGVIENERIIERMNIEDLNEEHRVSE